jgi:hypothetical protein
LRAAGAASGAAAARLATSPGLATPASAGVVRIQSAAQLVRILPRPPTVQLGDL